MVTVFRNWIVVMAVQLYKCIKNRSRLTFTVSTFCEVYKLFLSKAILKIPFLKPVALFLPLPGMISRGIQDGPASNKTRLCRIPGNGIVYLYTKKVGKAPESCGLCSGRLQGVHAVRHKVLIRLSKMKKHNQLEA